MKDYFENILIKDVHATRYIISYIKVGGKIFGSKESGQLFIKWLESEGLSEDDIDHIRLLCRGRLELESSAKEFLKLESK